MSATLLLLYLFKEKTASEPFASAAVLNHVREADGDTGAIAEIGDDMEAYLCISEQVTEQDKLLKEQWMDVLALQKTYFDQ